MQLWTKILVGIAALCGNAAAVSNPEEYVNTLGGTQSRYDLSRGNILPLVSSPWGFNGWAPQTDRDQGSWWFHPTTNRMYGIRCTHQPSPWISDWGNFLVYASVASTRHENDPDQFAAMDFETRVFKPYHFKSTLIPYSMLEGNMTVEVTSTSHGAVMRFSYPPYVEDNGFMQTRRVMIRMNDESRDTLTVDEEAGIIRGSTQANSGGVPVLDGNIMFRHHAYMEVSGGAKIQSSRIGTANNGDIYAFLEFDASDPVNREIVLKIGTSLISNEQAERNLRMEIGQKTFNQVLDESKAEWRETLLRADVTDVGSSYSAQEQSDFLTTFYSAMFRASLFPRMLNEIDENDQLVHYSPYDEQGRVFPGPISTDSGFWDSYRAVYPLTSITFPELVGHQVQGWVNAFTEGGWLPKWGSPGYRGGMTGTMADVTLADAIVKRIPNFDVETAYEGIRYDAFTVPTKPDGVGRVGLEAYMEYGYIPRDAQGSTGTVEETVSRTQNYALSDWSIAQAAMFLNRTEDAEILLQRADSYKQLWDSNAGSVSKGFFRAKDFDGNFVEPWDEFGWGKDYTEAGPWQFRFYAPHDPMGVAQLYGGVENMCAALDAWNDVDGVYHIGGYYTQIHEMIEMTKLSWGQNEHGNQPNHHVLWMYIAAGCPSNGQYWLRQTMTKLYKPTADMFAGDEDNGELSAWYLLSAMGVYALAPGSTEYIIGSPLFTRMEVQLGESGRTLEILAPNNNAENVYVQSVSLNGRTLDNLRVEYADLMQGGTLLFDMGPAKSDFGSVQAMRFAKQ